MKVEGGDQKTQSVSSQLIQNERQDPELARALRDYDLIRLDPRAAAAQIRNSGKLLLSTSKGNFDIQLVAHDMRSPDYVAQLIAADGVAHKLPKGPINTYKGGIKSFSGAQARMTVKGSSIEGAIITKNERFFLQPARSLSKTARDDEFVFYNSSDVVGETGSCGVTLAEEVAAAQARAGSHLEAGGIPQAAGPITGLSPMKIARLATDADAEYVSALGGAAQANAQIASIMNLVDGIYQVEIGITFQITFQNTWADAASDPYTSTAPSTLLGEFRNHWNANFTSVQRSLAHLWTGKDLNGGVIGVASLAVVCRAPDLAFGLSQKFPLTGSSITASTVVLTAHEIGHNFSAFHTNPPPPDPFVPPDIKQPCQQTIMEAFVGSGSSFCPFSRSQIIGHAFANSSCLLDSASAPPPFPPCVETSIDTGLFANGTLSTGDCRSPSRGVGHFADRYSFNAMTGEQLTISMTGTSGNLDPYLYLIGPDGYVLVQDDDSGGSQNSLIPAFGQFTLPLTGKYILETTSFGSDQIGNYTVNVTKANCTLSASPSSSHFSSSGGNGTVSVTAVGSCPNYAFSSTDTWLVHLITGGSGSSTLNFRVDPNATAAGRRGFLLVGAFSTLDGKFGGLRIPISQSGTGPDCPITPIDFGQTLNADLSTTDCQSPVRGPGFFSDRYVFNGLAGQQVAITASSPNAPNTDTFLTLIGPNGAVILTDDDSGGFTNSRIPGGPGFLTLGLAGSYIIEVGTFDGQTGPYTLNLTFAQASSNVSFDSATLTVSEGVDANGIGFEGTGFRTITVRRSGDVSAAATVDYGTSNGSADARKDYTQALGTLQFTPGETTKTFVVFIIDDVFLEPQETVNLFLSNPAGTLLGSTPTAVLSINSNDPTTGVNPVKPASFNAPFFVRQHYLDFLNREPDVDGIGFWVNQTSFCGDPDPRVCQINVSAAFYLSIEFQETGYLVYRMYKAAYGDSTSPGVPGTVPVIRLQEFLPDTQRIGQGVVVGVGNWQQQLENNKNANAAEFVARLRFLTAFPLSLTAAQFVDQLNTNAGGPLSQSERDILVNSLTGGTMTRAQVLRAVAEDQTLKDAEFRRAFVLMQYFGYLRRNPDDSPDTNFGGWKFWLDKLNLFNGNFVQAEMVKAFIESIEYSERFGP